jgi:hypothetical protein
LTHTYDLTTAIGQVRRLVGKLETASATALFTDEEITQELTESGNVIKIAAADLLDEKATYITEKKKSTTIGKYSINGPAMAADLRTHAAELRRQVDEDGSFDVAKTDRESVF